MSARETFRQVRALKSEFLRIAQTVMERYGKPMAAKELVRIAIDEKIMSDKRAGKTPAQTMKSKLSTHIRRYGESSIFVRTRPGRFFLRSLVVGGQPIYDAPPLNPPPSAERVLIFPSRWLDLNHRRFQGIDKRWRHYYSKLLNRPPCDYLDRIQAEQVDSRKQLLTYIMVTRKGEILSYRRGTYNRVEDFLRGSLCVGFGGHVSEKDLTLFNATDLGLMDSAMRELNEELELPSADKERLFGGKALKCVGVLNDDSSPAGRRHFAFVLAYEASDDPAWDRPQRREKSITQLRWLTRENDRLSFWEFEYWSQLLLREYYPDTVRAQPRFRIRRTRPLTPPHVLCVLGGVGSGKSEATRVLKEEYGYTEVNSGKVLADLLNVPPVPITPRVEFQDRSWRFISSPRGPALLASALCSEVESAASARVLIDGIRQPDTLRVLKQELLTVNKRVGILFVHAPPDVAFRLYCARATTPPTIHDFIRIKEAPVEQEVGQMLQLSDAVLYNWFGKLSYRRVGRRLMNHLLSRS